MWQKITRERITEVGHVILIAQNFWLIWDATRQTSTPWGKLVFLCVVAVILLFTAYLNIKAIRLNAANPSPSTSPTPEPPKNQRRETAINRIGELLRRGDYLVGQTPNSGATASDFCRFWNEQFQRWSQEVGTLLSDNWGQEAMNAFFSTRGLQWDQPAPRIHAEAVTSYHQLNRCLQNLEQLKQSLPKA